MTPRNTNYVRRLAQQGKDAPTIYQRIQERLTWDGPFPSFREVEEICNEHQRASTGRRDGTHAAGVRQNCIE